MSALQKLIQRAPSPEPFSNLKANFSVHYDKPAKGNLNIPKSYIISKPNVVAPSGNSQTEPVEANASTKSKLFKNLNMLCTESKGPSQTQPTEDPIRLPIPSKMQSPQQGFQTNSTTNQRSQIGAFSRAIEWKNVWNKTDLMQDHQNFLNKTSSNMIGQSRPIGSENSMIGESRTVPLQNQQSGPISSARAINKLATTFLHPTQQSNPIMKSNGAPVLATPLTELPMIKQVNSAKVRSKTPTSDVSESERFRTKDNMKQSTNSNRVAQSLTDLSSPSQSKRESFGVTKNGNEKKHESLPSIGTGKQFQNSEQARHFKETKKIPPHQAEKDVKMNISDSEPDSPVMTKKEQEKVKLKPTFTIPNYQPATYSVRGNGVVLGYAAATNRGIIRNYNEDRVSILLNIVPPLERAHENWPKCAFFAVFDGHGGSKCADYLKDHLHELIVNDVNFPKNPRDALRKGFETAEKEFCKIAQNSCYGSIDRSGSCAIAALIVGDLCYVANVGDSRAIMSAEGGSKIYSLSKDHKPMNNEEYNRIIDAGGKIYQSQYPAYTVGDEEIMANGPHRVFPGKLSVSRTFGDIEAKLPEYGGNPNCIIATPEIKMFKLTKDCDFIILASDGVFDIMSNRELLNSIWSYFEKYRICENLHEQVGIVADAVLQEAINKETTDNVTAVVIALENFQRKLYSKINEHPTRENVSRSYKDARKSPMPQAVRKSTDNALTERNQNDLSEKKADAKDRSELSRKTLADTKDRGVNKKIQAEVQKENRTEALLAQAFLKRSKLRKSSKANPDS